MESGHKLLFLEGLLGHPLSFLDNFLFSTLSLSLSLGQKDWRYAIFIACYLPSGLVPFGIIDFHLG